MTNKPLQIVVTGQPTWCNKLENALPKNVNMSRCTHHEHYVSRLATEQAAMVVVNGDEDNWTYWSTTPKASPATRRVPVVVVSDNPDIRAEAPKQGADLAFAPSELLDNLANVIAQHARIMDSDTAEQLDCDCAEALPALAQQGIDKFNAGEYYKQHDLFEELWVETERPVRDLYRAILQVGVAYYQIERGNHRGARKMLLRAVQWLELLPDVCQTINVAQLRTDAYAVRDALEQLPAADIAQFDKSLLKPVQQVKTT